MNNEDKEKKGENETSDVSHPRRSQRLMIKTIHPDPAPPAPPAAKKPRKKPEKELPRKMLACRAGAPIDLCFSELSPFRQEQVLDSANLVLQNHCLEQNQDWRGWNILKMGQISQMHSFCRLSFQAEKRDCDGALLVRKTTFNAHVLSNYKYTIVNGIRTPQTKWYRGKLWVPARPSPEENNFYGNPVPDARLIEHYREQRYSSHRFRGHDPLVPQTMYDSRSRDEYKLLEKTDEERIITPGTDHVDLELGKLSNSDVCILNGCATLAMQDHLIQTHTLEWEQWHVLNIQKAHREGPGGVTGYNYYLTFRAVHDDFENTLFKHCVLDRTLEAEVWDGMGQRRVNRFRAIMPHTTDWFPGNFWIPI